jgi:hypothetical protein
VTIYDSFAPSSNVCGGGVDRPTSDYWTDFESENGFEMVLPLATMLVQGFIEQRYSLTPEGPIHTMAHPQIMGLQAPLTAKCTDFESENGFEKVLPLAKIWYRVL